MNDAFLAQNVGGFAEIIFHVGLRADPIEITPDAFGEIDLRFVTGGADSSWFHSSGDASRRDEIRRSLPVRCECLTNQKSRNYFANRHAATAANVNWQAVEFVGSRG